jgi:hypothetical protein
MDIRTEKPEDLEAVRNVNIVAFGRENEANLVDRLRGIGSTFSFVACNPIALSDTFSSVWLPLKGNVLKICRFWGWHQSQFFPTISGKV